MADNSKYIQAQKFSLAVGAATTDTSITLQSFNFPDGTAIASGDLGSPTYGTLEPGSSREEQISFTGITSNADGTVTLTGVTRGLGFGAVDTYSEQSDLKVQHGAGATFIISNTAAFYDKFVNKANDETITGTLSVPTPTSGSHAVTKDYADGLTTATDLPYDRIIQAATAGESVSAGDLVYFDDTDNEWKKTVGTTAATLNNVLLGIAQGAGSNGGSISGGVLTYGLDSTQTGLTVGVKLYAGDTAGAIVESAGTVERVIGWSKSATEIYFDANVDTVPTADEKDALVGTSGSPSGSNKYVTADDVSTSNAADKIVRLSGVSGVSRVLTASSSRTSITNSVSTEQTIVSQALTANTLADGNLVRFTIPLETYTQGSTAGDNVTLRLKLGSTTLATITQSNSTTTGLQGYLNGYIVSDGASSQMGFICLDVATETSSGSTTSSEIRTMQSGTGTEDSTGALTFSVTVQWDGATSNSTITPAGSLIELIS